VERRGKYLAICADCEGDRAQIERLVAQVDRAGWKTNFFFVGETVREFPSLVREIAERHEAHSHTDTHPNLRGMPFEEQRAEILRGRDAVEDCLGRSAPGFRAPMHCLNRDTVRVLNEAGFAFDASNLYFRYDMGRVVEFPPTWFREWMPLYETLRVSPKAAFGLFKLLSRGARLPILPAHPHYAGLDDRLAMAFGDFLLWARDAGFQPAAFEDLMALPSEELLPLIGWQPALAMREPRPEAPPSAKAPAKPDAAPQAPEAESKPRSKRSRKKKKASSTR
jgi:peptidoglycan/xylan/chitin deacetylase (PgdA/CDA1 family)